MSESEATLHDWLMVVGIKDGELIAWEALKREAGPRLEPRCLDAALKESRPSLLDELLLNRQGRDFVLKLFLSSKGQSDYGGSDFLGLCLREIALLGHPCELFEEEDLNLCEDLHLFDSNLVDISIRTRMTLQNAAPWTLDWQAPKIMAAASCNMQRMCGSCVEAQCYALQFLRTLQAADVQDSFLWFSARHKPGWARVPEALLICQPLGPLKHALFRAVLQFLKDTSRSSLDQLASAYRACPCAPLLRAPVVAHRLFSVAFDSRLACEAIIANSSFLISVAATAQILHGEDGLFLACVSPWSETPAAAAEAACTAAAVAACVQRCLEERPTNHEFKARATISCWETLLAISLPFPAARHGIASWLKSCLVDPAWLSMRLSGRSSVSNLMCLLKRYASHRQSRRDVFEVLKVVLLATVTSDCNVAQNKHDLGDARRAALLALADLAATWYGAPLIYYFLENTSSVDASELRLFVVQLSRRVMVPLSKCFVRSTASLLSSGKAAEIWQKLSLFSHEDQHAFMNLTLHLRSNRWWAGRLRGNQ